MRPRREGTDVLVEAGRRGLVATWQAVRDAVPGPDEQAPRRFAETARSSSARRKALARAHGWSSSPAGETTGPTAGPRSRLPAARRRRVPDHRPRQPPMIPPCDLLIDAAYGTGLNRSWTPPDSASPGARAVFWLWTSPPAWTASRVEVARRTRSAAARTVTFAALKPGLLLQPGRTPGGVRSASPTSAWTSSSATAQLLTDRPTWPDLWPRREVDAHKWRSACWVVAGSPPHARGGVARLAGGAAVGSRDTCASRCPVASRTHRFPPRWSSGRLPAADWHERMDTSRFGSLVVGPGLGRAPQTATAVCATGGALDRAPGAGRRRPGGARRRRWGPSLAAARAPVVLTPHDGEYELLAGRAGPAPIAWRRRGRWPRRAPPCCSRDPPPSSPHRTALPAS